MRRGQGAKPFFRFHPFFQIQFKNTSNLISLGFKMSSERFLFKIFKTGLIFWHMGFFNYQNLVRTCFHIDGTPCIISQIRNLHYAAMRFLERHFKCSFVSNSPRALLKCFSIIRHGTVQIPGLVRFGHMENPLGPFIYYVSTVDQPTFSQIFINNFFFFMYLNTKIQHKNFVKM